MGATTTGSISNFFAAVGRFGADLWSGVFPQLSPILAQMTNAMDSMAQAAAPIGARIGEAFSAVLVGVQGLVGWLKEMWPVLAVVTGGIIAYVAAVKTMAIISAITTAIRTMTAAQWSLNAAFMANPIGFVVAALTALVAGVVYAYTQFGWFRDIVNGAWNGIKIAAQAVADWFMTYVWPTMSAVLNGVGAAFTWLWQNVISPAFNGIVAVIRWAINNVVIPLFNAYVAYLRTIVFPIFRFLYENVVKPVFAAIVTVISWAWAGIKVIWDAISWYIKNILSPIFSVLLGVVKFVWNAIVAVIRWAWNNIIKPIWAAIQWYINNILAPVFRFLLAVASARTNSAIARITPYWNVRPRIGANFRGRPNT